MGKQKDIQIFQQIARGRKGTHLPQVGQVEDLDIHGVAA